MSAEFIYQAFPFFSPVQSWISAPAGGQNGAEKRQTVIRMSGITLIMADLRMNPYPGVCGGFGRLASLRYALYACLISSLITSSSLSRWFATLSAPSIKAIHPNVVNMKEPERLFRNEARIWE